MSAAPSDLPKYPQTLSERFYAARFVLIHIACFAAIWTGVTWQALVLCFALYFIRMFGVTAGYHRYFSHRTYKMGRVMQFLMACLAQSSMQRSVLWWASNHRHHHKFSDQPEDVHSVKHDGFFWAHIGWVFSPRWDEIDMSRVKDLARYPELRFLVKVHYLPALLLAIGCWLWMGWTGLVVGFIWSTVLLWHGTFTINSLAHVIGTRRYDTDDDSRNSWFLAIITLGEGWHNNHHYFQASVNQGFFWWEIDITYYILWAMSKVGLVYDLKTPPRHVIENKPHPAVLLRQAAKNARQDFENRWQELKESAHKAREEAAQRVEDLGHEFALRIEEMCHDAEQRLEDLSQSVQGVRRGAYEKLEKLANDASEHLDALSQEMALKLAQLHVSARESSENAASAINEIAEITQLRLQGGASVSQA